MFQYLKQSKPHIILLQETHLDGNRVMALHKPWIQRALHSTYSTFARGVSILISRSVPCTIQRVISDPGGRYVAVVLDVYHCQILLVNVYIPPPFQVQLLYDMLTKLAQFLHLPTLFLGDCNAVLDAALDSSNLGRGSFSRFERMGFHGWVGRAMEVETS